MRYVIGLEGGHNSITAVVAEETGCLLGMGVTSFSHPLSVEESERLHSGIGNAVREALVMADLEQAQMAGICIAGNSAIEALVSPGNLALPSDCVFLADESRLAHLCVTLGRPGIVVIAGAGARAFGLNSEGASVCCGGWGLSPGDEGSETWIALRCLHACFRSADGISPSTQLLPLLLNHLEAPDLAYLHQRIASRGLSRDDAPALVEVVSRAGAQGDPAARAILRDAGRELALLAYAAHRKLNSTDLPTIVGTVGRVFRAGRLLLKSFRETLHRLMPGAQITPPQVSFAVAAALLALEEMGLPLHEERIARVEFTLPRLNVGKL